MRFLPALLVLLTLTLSNAPACAQLVIVSGRDSAIAELSRAQAERLYLGRTTTLPDNTVVTLIDLPPGADRDRFYFELIGKNPVQTRAYWSRQVFTGRALPPRQAASVDELRQWLSEDRHAIGYLRAELVGTDLRVLLQVTP